MDIDQVRRENIKRLELEIGGIKQLATAVGMSYAQCLNYKSGVPDSKTGKTRGMRKETARRFEEACGKPVGWLDKEPVLVGSGSVEQAAAEAVGVGFARPPAASFHLLDVRAACGSDYQNIDYPEVIRTIVMSPEEAVNRIGNVNKSGSIKVIVARGDSMTPTISPDDLLFVDTATSEYTCEGIYILLHDGEVACKRLSKAGKTLIVSSDNKKTPSWEWKDRLEQDRIIGRVLCALPIKIKKF